MRNDGGNGGSAPDSFCAAPMWGGRNFDAPWVRADGAAGRAADGAAGRAADGAAGRAADGAALDAVLFAFVLRLRLLFGLFLLGELLRLHDLRLRLTTGFGLTVPSSWPWRHRRRAAAPRGRRRRARGQAVVDEIRDAGGGAELLVMDLASFASVREAARRLAAERSSLDVLVNNAGCVLRERQVTADGHETTWQTNFLGGFLLTRLLLPLLKNAPAPRVVNVSSEAHRTGRIDFSNLELERGYGAFRAYANSKLAQIHFTRELARREPTLLVNAVHPGTISTGIWRPAPAWLRFLARLLLSQRREGRAPRRPPGRGPAGGRDRPLLRTLSGGGAIGPRARRRHGKISLGRGGKGNQTGVLT